MRPLVDERYLRAGPLADEPGAPGRHLVHRYANLRAPSRMHRLPGPARSSGHLPAGTRCPSLDPQAGGRAEPVALTLHAALLMGTVDPRLAVERPVHRLARRRESQREQEHLDADSAQVDPQVSDVDLGLRTRRPRATFVRTAVALTAAVRQTHASAADSDDSRPSGMALGTAACRGGGRWRRRRIGR